MSLFSFHAVTKEHIIMAAYQSWLSRCHELNDAFLQICCEFKLSWHIVVNLWSLSQIARSAEADGNQYKTMRNGL